MGKTWMWLGIVALLSIAFFTGALWRHVDHGFDYDERRSWYGRSKGPGHPRSGEHSYRARPEASATKRRVSRPSLMTSRFMAQGLQVLNFAASIPGRPEDARLRIQEALW